MTYFFLNYRNELGTEQGNVEVDDILNLSGMSIGDKNNEDPEKGQHNLEDLNSLAMSSKEMNHELNFTFPDSPMPQPPTSLTTKRKSNVESETSEAKRKRTERLVQSLENLFGWEFNYIYVFSIYKSLES